MKKIFSIIITAWFFYISQPTGELKLSPPFETETACWTAYGTEVADLWNEGYRVHYCWSDGQ